jgi:hypothetical protein
LDPEITIEPPLTLRGFCEALFRGNSEKWPPDEYTIATGFVFFFRLERELKFKDLEQFCRDLGVEVSVQKLPRELRGHNHRYQGKRGIVVGAVAETALPGIREHTLFHELRELIEYEFREIGHPVAANFSDLESRAETFAGGIRTYGAIKGWQPLLEGIGEIKSGWAKLGLGLLLFLIVGANALACLFLPHLEDRLPGMRN